MKLNYIVFITLLCAFVGTSVNAFIYEASVWRKWDEKRKRFHYFIGCSDFHDKSHASNSVQLNSIEGVLARCDKDSTKIVLEDLSSRNSSGNFACGDFCINSRGGVLGGLADKCTQLGFKDVDNVEFRYCRVTTLGQVINNLHADAHQLPSVSKTKVSALIDEFSSVAREIQAYKDGDYLTKYYAKMIKEAYQGLRMFDMERHPKKSIAAYINDHVPTAERLTFLKHMLTFDSVLLDLKVLHAVVNAGHRQKVIAFAGGAHIERVTDVLKKIGYESVHVSKAGFVKEYDLKKCYVGSEIVNGQYCIKPNPIEKKFFDQYL